MKTSINLFIILIVVLTSLSAKADINFADYEKEINSIRELEAAQQWMSATLMAMEAASKVVRDAKLDVIQDSTEPSLDSINQETLVSTEKFTFGIVRRGLFGFLSFLSIFASQDITKMVVANPEEIAGFGAKIRSDREKLRELLVSVFKDKTAALYLAKILTAKAISLTKNLSDEDLFKLSPYLKKILSRVSHLSLAGMQNISRCEVNKYIDNGASAAISFGTSFFAVGLGLEDLKKAFNEKKCTRDSNLEHVSELDSIPVLKADLILAAEIKAMELRILIGTMAPKYPTWNSPYYK